MLVIFDCDGVLVDSETVATGVLTRAVNELGLPFTEQRTVDEFMGRSRKYVVARLETLRGAPVPDGWEAAYDARRDAAFRSSLRTVDGVEAAVDAVEAAGHTTCVASSGDHGKMRLTLGLTGLYERFEGRIFSATEVAHGKPEPDLFLYAAERMGFAVTDCVVVEDSPAGVQAARAAGIRVLGYGVEADTTFARMADLPALL